MEDSYFAGKTVVCSTAWAVSDLDDRSWIWREEVSIYLLVLLTLLHQLFIGNRLSG